jgi:hypothetical protein
MRGRADREELRDRIEFYRRRLREGVREQVARIYRYQAEQAEMELAGLEREVAEDRGRR